MLSLFLHMQCFASLYACRKATSCTYCTTCSSLHRIVSVVDVNSMLVCGIALKYVPIYHAASWSKRYAVLSSSCNRGTDK